MSPSERRTRFTRLKDWWFGLQTWQQFVLAGVVVGGVFALASATGGNERDVRVTPNSNAPTQPATSDTTAQPERCSTFGANVLEYDILLPGASRAEYLTLLHKLQRDCPEEAERRGLTGVDELTGVSLPQCERLDQDDCTMYRTP